MKSEKGFTLVELLASLALLSLVIMLAGSMHVFGQKQFSEQTKQVSQVNDLRYIMVSIERDVRQTFPEEINWDEDLKILTIGDSVYTLSQNGNTLKKGNQIMSNQIKEFNVELDDNRLDVYLSSTIGKNNKIEDVSTTIYFRR